MNDNLFIPKKINVGYKENNECFSKKLAYVIYYDEKDTLRKEKSWQTWRDKNIENDILFNKPIDGFVLNKKAGGYSNGWDYRQSYVRVYDPRGFEIEITIPNLLFILDYCNCIKGKGLEGDFVYCWQGTQLILLPEDCKEYVKAKNYSDILFCNKTITAKELVEGKTYLLKNNIEVVYMGKHLEYNLYCDSMLCNGKSFFFYDVKEDEFFTCKSVNKKIVDIVNDEIVDNYADIFTKLTHWKVYSPIDHSKDEYKLYDLEFIKDLCKKRLNCDDCFCLLNGYIKIRNEYFYCSINSYKNYSGIIDLDIIKNPSIYPHRETKKYNSLEELFFKYSDFYYKIEYLKNGNLYKNYKGDN